MIKLFRKRMSILTIIIAMLITTLMPVTALGAAAQINISNLYTTTNTSVTPARPMNDSQVQRFTTNSVSIAANIQNINDDQVPDIYYEIQNFSTGVTSTITTNKADHTAGTFEIMFNNVILTEGLNKVVIKLGTSSVIASAPGWAYFTATTNISNLQVNNLPFDSTKLFPDNPTQGSSITIRGDAANATSVTAFVLGNSTEKSAFLNNGKFFFTADDAAKNNSTATFGLQAGDNLLTLVSKNSNKSYQTTQNLIYDNGKPFAFNAKIQAEDTNKLPVGPAKDLITMPTITTHSAQISAQLKDDLAGSNANSPIKYRYMDIVVNGQVSGTYDMLGAAAATTAMSVSPSQFTEGYQDTFVSIVGTGLDSPGLSVTLEDRTGASPVILNPSLDANNVPIISTDKQTALYTVKKGSITTTGSPYKLTVLDGTKILNTFTLTASLPSPSTLIAGLTNITVSAITYSQGYPLSTGSINFGGFTPTPGAVTIDVLNLNGQGVPIATYIGKAGATGNDVNFDIMPGLLQGKYKIKVSYNTYPLKEGEFEIDRALPLTPIANTPTTAAVLTSFVNIPSFNPLTLTPTYFSITGTNLGTSAADISNITIQEDVTAGPQVAFNAGTNSLSINDVRATSFKYTINASAKTASAVYATGVNYTAPLTAALPIADQNHLSVVSLDAAGKVNGYHDYIVSVSAGVITGAINSNPTPASNNTLVTATVAQGNNIIFKVDKPSDPFFTDGANYMVTFKQQLRYSDGTVSGAPVTVGPIKNVALTSQAAPTTDQFVTGITPLQILKGANQNTTDITITGNNFITKSLFNIQLYNEDGTIVSGTGSVLVNTASGTSSTAIANIQPSLAGGNYFIRVIYNGTQLAQYPFVLADPKLNNISPPTGSSSNSLITVLGSGLGRDETQLKLGYSFDNDPSIVIATQNAVTNSLIGGGAIQFPVPNNLQQGTYTVTLLYNNLAVGTATYTVNSAPTTLKENAAMSRMGRYKVFDFIADLSLSTSKIQNVQFQFYNVTTDKSSLVPRLFIFNYIDPTLPYVDYVSKGDRSTSSDFALSLAAVNEINELPEMFNVYADVNTNKVNIYMGDMSGNTPISKTMVNPAPAGADYTITQTTSSLSASNTQSISPTLTPGAYKLTILGNSVWLPGDKITIDNVTFTATLGTTNSNSFDLGNNTASTIATNLIAALAFNPGLSARYTITAGAAGVINFTQKPSYETPLPLTASDTSVGGSATASTTTPYASTTPAVSTTTILGAIGGADSITVTVKNGGISLPITTDSISVKGKTLDQIASSIATKLSQIGVNGYSVSNASGTTNVVFTQNFAFSTPSTAAVTLTINGGYNIFSFKIKTLANGPTKLTAVPATYNPATLPALPAKSGENLTGARTYDLNVLSTPYVILNNIYDGMILKDDPNTTTVEKQSNLIVCGSLDSCITGRLVNVPSNEYGNVEVTINNIKSNLRNPLTPVPPTPTSDFDDLTLGRFHYQFGPNAGPAERRGVLTEGKNTIKFSIYGNGQLLTEDSFNVFVLSNSAPSFVSIKPDETLTNASIIKFSPAGVIDSYATSETQVSFIGQFLNGDDIKLTVKTTDDAGQIVSSYDRRYDPLHNPIPSFTTIDPTNGNPNYLVINPVTSKFTTNLINLAKKGNTTFEFAITNSTGLTVNQTITITREAQAYRVLWPVLTLTPKKDYQANINSNYIEIEMEAEGADKITFGTDDAIARQVTDSNNNQVVHFFHEVTNLKAGANKISFNVITGKKSVPGTFILFNTDTPIESAQFKTLLKPKITAFNNSVQLTFPTNTNLLRNDQSVINQYISTNRSILFGIANSTDGRIDKFKHPADNDGQFGNTNPKIPPEAPLLITTKPTLRFTQASQLYWIDAGTIPATETDMNKALNGGGRDPYDAENFYSRSIKDLVVPSKRGTLTLKYDPNIRDDAWRYITVYHYDIYEDYTGSVQYRWKNLGGVIDTAKNTITVPFDTFGYYQVMYMNQSFDDVTGHPWARNQLDTVYAKGIMLNKDSANFLPNDPISRGEFTSLLVKIFDIPLNFTETPTFSDVLRFNTATNGLYDYMSIETAARAGIIRGSGGGNFSPDATITRQDAAAMIARAADLKLASDPDKSLINLQKSFTDANSISLYARTAVEAVTKAGLITGKANVLLQGQKKTTFRYDPVDTLTRAETSQIAMQVLRSLKKIPK